MCPSFPADSRSPEAWRRQLARRAWVGAVLTLVAAGVGVDGAVAAGTAAPEAARTYIVELAGPPAAAYTGGVSGYAATRPRQGQRLDSRAARVARYSAHLRQRHNAVLARVPRRITRTYDYTLVFNGFAARMAPGTAAQLARTPGVLSVSPDRRHRLQTITTPAFLGLTGATALWNQLGGFAKAGTGVVVGVIDSGITPQAPSFAPLASPGKLHAWNGVCQTGEHWTAADCSNKIIGARYYTAGEGGPDAIHQQFPFEFVSPRDRVSHGTHVAGTAAGDHGVTVTVSGNPIGQASGMAPNARIAVYKACFAGACVDSDVVQAVEDATADGVDVINYSSTGSQNLTGDPLSRAFLFAADAGVFVAVAAGNDGPGRGTVQHVEPWVTTVAGGTHDRNFPRTITLGNGAQYAGAGSDSEFPPATPTLPLVRAQDAGLDAAHVDGARQCFSKRFDPSHPEGFLDPAKVGGKIVVCERGANARYDTVFAVREAGGAGMILSNVSGGRSDVTELSEGFLPFVEVRAADGSAIEAYASGSANPTAALSDAVETVGQEAPSVMRESSRGPTSDGNVLKPDILAPGYRIYGPTVDGFAAFVGTSMASPHVAGLAALLIQSHPNWSPMAVKSALLTTAAALTNKGHPIPLQDSFLCFFCAAEPLAGPFDYGSGAAAPTAANDPGLVYDSALVDWERWSCGMGVLAPDSPDCQLYGSADPGDLNTPNIAVGSLPAVQTVTRKVTNVGPKPSNYSVQVTPPPGFSVAVNPTTLKLSGNGTRAKYTVTFTRTTAPLDAFSSGSLVWSDGQHSVRSQLVVRPVRFTAAQRFTLSGASGSQTLPVRAGYAGSLQTTVGALSRDDLFSATLTNPTQASFDTDHPATNDHVAKFTVSAPSNGQLTRFATHASEAPGADIDLYVYKAGTTELVGVSAGGTAEEHVDLPAGGGDYDVYADLFALPEGATTQDVVLHALASPGWNLTVTPSTTSVQAGQTVNLTLTWSGLTPGTHYFGRLSYSDLTTTLGTTDVEAGV
jgi:subtilisin family serine protease